MLEPGRPWQLKKPYVELLIDSHVGLSEILGIP